MADEDLFVLSSVKSKSRDDGTAQELLSLPDTDDQGRVLFRDSLSSERFTQSLNRCLQSIKVALDIASTEAAAYSVDSVKVKLGVDASVGCAFLCDSSVESSIEITLKRRV